ARQGTDFITIPGFGYKQQKFFKIRAKDYNDNYSELSNEVSAMTPPALISDFEAIGKDAQTTLQWIVQIQEGNQGFVVYRMGEVGFFEAIDSWETNPDLAGSPLPDVHYIFDDFDVTNGEYYYYKIAAVNTQGIEFMYNIQVGCSPRPIYNLFVSNFLGDITDSVAFSANPYASDYYDNNYDLYKSDSIPSEYIYAAFYEQGWGPEGAYLSQETHGYYEPIIDFKLWKLRVKTNQFNQPIKIFVSSNFPANFENLYLENYQTGQIVDLADSNMTFTTSNSDYLDFTLYWGYFEPQISFVSADNRIYQAGDTLSISWSTDFNILIEHFDISLQNNTDSLFVARNLSNTTTSYYWDIPDSITFHNANVILDAYLRNFEIIRVCSPYYLGVVPSQVTLLGDTNWSMISNPWPDEILEVSTVFGDSAELFSFNTEEEYISEVRFEFGKGYWLHVLDSFNYVDSASVQKTSFEILMHHGWNLIANPHLCIYNIKDLKFNLNSIEYSFSEMLSQCLISRAVYVYRDGSYQLVEYINPKESFLIYSYIEELSELSCIFLPYNIGAPILPLDLGWQLQLIATQEGSDGDDMVVGASESASDNYDFSYDLSEPPLKPFTDGLALYFPKDLQTDSLYLHDRLHWEYKEPLSETVPEEKIWNFALKISEINPVTFYSDFINIPDGYSVKMLLNDNEIDIIEDEIYIIVPNQTGILNGEMIIQNDLFVSCDKECPIAVELNNYPNPFKIKTNIVFFLPQSTNVKIEIYNIKGQLIKQFKIQSPIKLGTKFKIKEVVWDGRDENGNPVANGIYFCKLTSGDKSAVKKMILIK
ncbi:MAG: T9SS type A sorting domain-containing protein, partial [Candidatus Cloacimonetes bacterium]|nr:T9SS type A sorting domain-containing protein [Candidatus Cloacimonadota bacterium]